MKRAAVAAQIALPEVVRKDEHDVGAIRGVGGERQRKHCPEAGYLLDCLVSYTTAAERRLVLLPREQAGGGLLAASVVAHKTPRPAAQAAAFFPNTIFFREANP